MEQLIFRTPTLLRLLLTIWKWAYRKTNEQHGDNKNMSVWKAACICMFCGLLFLLYPWSIPTLLILSYPLNINYIFFLPTKHKIHEKHYVNFRHPSQMTALLSLTASTCMFYRVVWPLAFADICFSLWQQIKAHFTCSIDILNSKHSTYSVITH